MAELPPGPDWTLVGHGHWGGHRLRSAWPGGGSVSLDCGRSRARAAVLCRAVRLAHVWRLPNGRARGVGRRDRRWDRASGIGPRPGQETHLGDGRAYTTTRTQGLLFSRDQRLLITEGLN